MFRVVIPARYGSSRLPGKPLLRAADKPLLQWVHEKAKASLAAEIIIATDDDRIVVAGRAFGADVRMTSLTHVSGTDRVAEIAVESGWDDDDIVVNLQGDEPLMPPALINQVASVLERNATAEVATLAGRIGNLTAFMNPNVVKVVMDLTGRALFFSRAPIPWSREGAIAGISSQRSFTGARRHIGLYAYRVGALRRLSSLQPTLLEQLEKLEQLRALENGMDIRVEEATVEPGPDVNTTEDLTRVALLLAAGKTASPPATGG